MNWNGNAPGNLSQTMPQPQYVYGSSFDPNAGLIAALNRMAAALEAFNAKAKDPA